MASGTTTRWLHVVSFQALEWQKKMRHMRSSTSNACSLPTTGANLKMLSFASKVYTVFAKVTSDWALPVNEADLGHSHWASNWPIRGATNERSLLSAAATALTPPYHGVWMKPNRFEDPLPGSVHSKCGHPCSPFPCRTC